MDNTIFYGFFLALAIVLVILGSISNSKTDNKDGKNAATGVIVIGLIFLVGSSFMLYSQYNSSKSVMYY